MSTNHQSRHRRRRLAPALTALAIGAGTIALTDTPASAYSLPEVCTGEATTATICLNGYTDTSRHEVHIRVDIDVHMTREEAQSLVNAGFSLTATMYGDDGPNVIQVLPDSAVTKVTPDIVSDGGLSAVFERSVPASSLDEDQRWWACFWPSCDLDEVFARVELYNPFVGGYRRYDSGRWIFYADAV
jgi:hypothetical protein